MCNLQIEYKFKLTKKNSVIYHSTFITFRTPYKLSRFNFLFLHLNFEQCIFQNNKLTQRLVCRIEINNKFTTPIQYFNTSRCLLGI